VAAPTAGLHFTRKSFSDLSRKGILTTDLTLHVGAGTFQPVKTENIASHEMHTEHFSIDLTAIESVLKNIGNIIAVGTTSVRALESLYWLGVKLCGKSDAEPSELFIDQWEPYTLNCCLSSARSLETILSWMAKKGLSSLQIPTRIIIVPGYNFRITEGLITNFHLPGSTLLLLVSAFTGDRWKEIYNYALGNNFRFLSYGDSSILLK
jgi:S-adenosylmethionine:tRNA ribosyltransferase-isomerase